ncbi:hypothetical protein ACFDTO_11125 [Microbacteriaceae bacterium 4G12]
MGRTAAHTGNDAESTRTRTAATKEDGRGVLLDRPDRLSAFLPGGLSATP